VPGRPDAEQKPRNLVVSVFAGGQSIDVSLCDKGHTPAVAPPGGALTTGPGGIVYTSYPSGKWNSGPVILFPSFP
jgi:hypothetical protein